MAKGDVGMGGNRFVIGLLLKDCKFDRQTIRLRIREKFLDCQKRGIRNG
jgi:hypothetical protein